MGELGAAWALAWMKRAAQEVALARIDLIELDRAIGDGDHGENLDRGFSAIVRNLDETAANPAEVFKFAASTLISTVGGAAGPLYGTAFLRAAREPASSSALDGAGVAAVIRACLEGIVHRGKAVVGDKTMVDAWAPAAAAAEEAAASGAGPLGVLESAAAAARAGAEDTEPLVARKGRASYLGERSAGHRDPGAESSALLLTAAFAAGKELNE